MMFEAGQGNMETKRVNWLYNILDSIHDGVLVVDAHSIILYANPSYTRNLGVPVKKVLGKKLAEIEPESLVLQVLETGRPIVDQRQRIYSLAKEIVANITPLREGDKIVGAVAIFRDISEVLELQKKLNVTQNEMEKVKNLSSKYYSELRALKNRFFDSSDFVFKSAKIKQVVELVHRLSEVESTVLISGETGSGKEVIAKMIHKTSKRADGPFVIVNCGAIPENLLESELFGYEKGAFTGANKEGKIGLIEVANEGTLLLDEV
ncbi:MAG: sigma 54-interacting transcriptional regulator, partial [Firmicutes bacterium]|nr:sigma 54-interacting transcriptional regulator [Bacillota bacterium]